MKRVAVGMTVCLVAVAFLGYGVFGARPPERERYPYGGEAFTRFVTASCRATGYRDANAFYDWFDRAAFRGSGDWHGTIARGRDQIAHAASPDAVARVELNLAAQMHRTVKRAIPRFSLDRGFEFTNVMRRGERQCLLQSVLIAGLLQGMGADAGTVMVWRNETGETTNNGHAVTLLRLPNGRDVLVDASDSQPFARHQGLFLPLAAGAGYAFVEPAYAPGSAQITGYRTPDGRRLSISAVRPLDNDFLRSQFDYYRGERAPGGLLSGATPRGLQTEARYLRASVAECPQNPLATYMLGRVLGKMGKPAASSSQLRSAYRLYARQGWVPPQMRDALAEAR